MKKLLLILVFVVVSALMFNYSAIAKNAPGPPDTSGDGISDGGLGGTDGHTGNDAEPGEGPAPSSGDGDSDGSGMDGGNGDDGDNGTDD